MKTYLISYDLRIPETSEDYKLLIASIKSIGECVKPLKSVWIVKTTWSVSEIRDYLKTEIDPNDVLFVIDITNKSWASKNINSKIADWMKINIKLL